MFHEYMRKAGTSYIDYKGSYNIWGPAQVTPYNYSVPIYSMTMLVILESAADTITSMDDTNWGSQIIKIVENMTINH